MKKTLIALGTTLTFASSQGGAASTALLLTLFSLGTLDLAAAQETKDCFSIIPPVASSPMPWPMKLNRCDGTTWILVRVYGSKPKDGGMAPFAFRWFPIQDGGSQESSNREPSEALELSRALKNMPVPTLSS
jgi:hypothetical protein